MEGREGGLVKGKSEGEGVRRSWRAERDNISAWEADDQCS